MAHTCPECWKYCTCQGDWDDIDFGDWYGCACDCQKYPDMSDFVGDDEQKMHLILGESAASDGESNPAPKQVI
jgi:hypothetical protein